MKTSEKGIDFIKSFEALKLESYKCPAGVWTIGYGHTKGVQPGQKITEAQALALLKGDLLNAENAVNKELGDRINQNQFDALVSFVFNAGTSGFKNSTLLRYAKNNPSDYAVGEQMKRWIWITNPDNTRSQSAGLIRRRNAEAAMYHNLNQ